MTKKMFRMPSVKYSEREQKSEWKKRIEKRKRELYTPFINQERDIYLNRIKCPLCSRTFKGMKSLAVHIKIKHEKSIMALAKILLKAKR